MPIGTLPMPCAAARMATRGGRTPASTSASFPSRQASATDSSGSVDSRLLLRELDRSTVFEFELPLLWQ